MVRALDALPEGMVRGRFDGRAYVATKTVFAWGKSLKLVAEELGGRDYISLNLYRLASGPRVYPCEMCAEKVAAFVLGFRAHPRPKEPLQPNRKVPSPCQQS